jgi:predicted nuclease of predicted toxin-antitoxin system
MRFLLDANIPRSSLEIFEALDQKAVHVTEIGLGAATDEEIAIHAIENKSIIVTKDLDFGTLAVLYKMPVYGIVILRLPFTATAPMIKESLRSFLSAVNLKTLVHSLVIVEPTRYRIRKL